MDRTSAEEQEHRLTAAVTRRLADEWCDINWTLFGDRMRPPVIELVDGQDCLGTWHPDGRRLTLSRDAVMHRPWTQTIEVLKHEMAHQFVDEILGARDRPHGPVFRRVCEARGIDPAPRETSSQATAPTRRQDKVVDRVRKLLALAQSSNLHEAELAAATAQRMMLKYNIDVAHRTDAADPELGHLVLGKPTGRVQAYHRKLAGLLTRHFFVQGIWIPVYRPREDKTGTVLEICGRAENLEMAQFVYHFVLQTIDRLWKEHKRAQGLRSNRGRRTFFAGAIDGFDAQLSSKNEDAAVEGLVWRGDAGVDEYFNRRHPRTRSCRPSQARDQGDAYFEGHAAGRSIVLSRPVSSSTDTDGRPRALPRGK